MLNDPVKFAVVVDGQYGTNEGSIRLMDGHDEIVMWDSREWIEDPSLMFVIANAIRQGYAGEITLANRETSDSTGAAPVAALLARLTETLLPAAEQAGGRGADLADGVRQLFAHLQPRAYPPSADPETGDAGEQILLTIYGVDLDLAPRGDGLSLHVEPGDMPHHLRPLIYEIGNAGESTYGDPRDD